MFSVFGCKFFVKLDLTLRFWLSTYKSKCNIWDARLQTLVKTGPEYSYKCLYCTILVWFVLYRFRSMCISDRNSRSNMPTIFHLKRKWEEAILLLTTGLIRARIQDLLCGNTVLWRLNALWAEYIKCLVTWGRIRSLTKFKRLSMAECVSAQQVKLLWLCSPNNLSRYQRISILRIVTHLESSFILQHIYVTKILYYRLLWLETMVA